MNADGNTRGLATSLRETAELLEMVGESFWSARLRGALAEAQPDVRAIRSWFGGIGSFNDLVLARVNGHKVGQLTERAANDRLDILRGQLWALSTPADR